MPFMGRDERKRKQERKPTRQEDGERRSGTSRRGESHATKRETRQAKKGGKPSRRQVFRKSFLPS